MLQKLLVHAGYKPQRQNEAMAFYYSVIIQRLGPKPTPNGHTKRWRSFMTDDFSPIEFSWYWGNVEKLVEPKVRFSIEAIGDQAGTLDDPWNRIATFNLVNQLRFIIPGLDLHWFDTLSRKLVSENNNEVSAKYLELHGNSSFFLAFELVDRIPKVKAYSLPHVRAIQTSQPLSAIILDTLSSIARESVEWLSILQLIEFLEMAGKNPQLEPFIVGFDCVVPSRSRIKVYVRSSETTFASVETLMSMFDESNDIEVGLRELRQLWQLTFGLESNFCSRQSLPFKAHCTAGILYYFEVRPGHPGITSKVYLPVKHYGRNDQDIAQGLVTFLRSRNPCSEPRLQSYLKFLHETCTYRSLGSACGLQTYISCSLKNGSLDVTSYLSPEIYHEGRWNAEVKET